MQSSAACITAEEHKVLATHVNVLPAEEVRLWPCCWPWLHATRSDLVPLNIFPWWGVHSVYVILILHGNEADSTMHGPSDWHSPHWIETSRAQPIHSIDSTPFFLKLCAGTCNISHTYLHWGFNMTQVAVNNKAAWDPWEGIPEEVLGPLNYAADAPVFIKSL